MRVAPTPATVTMVRRLLLSVAAAMAVLPASAGAQAWYQTVPQADGTLALSGGGPGTTVRRCEPGGDCVEVAAGADGFFATGDPPPGTTFVVRPRGQAEEVTTPPWRGAIRLTAAPAVEGEVRVGAYVRPLAAGWSGGFGDEGDWLQLQACPSATSLDGCVVVGDSVKGPLCEGGAAVLESEYEGRFLRVVDVRLGRGVLWTAEAYVRPEGISPLPGRSALSSQVVAGRIAAATGSRDPRCPRRRDLPKGAPPPPPLPVAPKATVLRRPRVVAGRAALATVRCEERCRTVLRAGGVRRVVLAPARRTTRLTVSVRQLRSLRRERRSVLATVTVDGLRAARGRVRLRG